MRSSRAVTPRSASSRSRAACRSRNPDRRPIPAELQKSRSSPAASSPARRTPRRRARCSRSSLRPPQPQRLPQPGSSRWLRLRCLVVRRRTVRRRRATRARSDGRLRVAIAISPLGGPFWSTNAGGKASGVPVDLGRELARRLGVPVDYVAYENSGQITDAVGTGRVGRHLRPGRCGTRDEACVRTDLQRRRRNVPRARRPPGGERGSARSCRHARRSGHQYDDDARRRAVAQEHHGRRLPKRRRDHRAPGRGEIDAFANLRDQLVPLSARIPGSRVLPGAFQQTKTAIAVPPGRPNALAYASAFLADVKTGGFLRAALDAHGLQDTKI